MPTKVMKYQIIKPIDCDWNLLGMVLRNIQRDTQQIMNKTIQLCWEWQGFAADYKKKYGEYPKTSDVSKYKNIDGIIYNNIIKDYKNLQKGNLSISIRRAIQRWKSDLKSVIIGEKSIASYKADVPIDLHNKSIHLYKENNSYCLVLSLLSIPYRKELGRKTGMFTVVINEGNKGSKDILERCISGEYDISASQIIKRNNKWLFYLSYSFKGKKLELDKNVIMGIDMGIVYPIYFAINNSPIRGKIDGGEIERFRRQVEKRKKQLQLQGKYAGEGRIGHGVKTRLKPIGFAQDKIANFRSTANHKYSRYIIDFAVRNRCGVIQMEDLEGISKQNTFLKNWSYYDLQQKIKYKAEENGIEVKFVNPQYTSQRCSKCGHIDKENRPEQTEFKCRECGFETNADYNAALNIAIPDIDKIISEKLKCET